MFKFVFLLAFDSMLAPLLVSNHVRRPAGTPGEEGTPAAASYLLHLHVAAWLCCLFAGPAAAPCTAGCSGEQRLLLLPPLLILLLRAGRVGRDLTQSKVAK